MLIQLFLSLFIIFALIKVAGRFRVKELSISGAIFWILFWLLVAAAVWQPDLSTNLANRVGVGRGADLITYVSLAVLFYLFFRLLARLEKIDKNITKIIRKLALSEEKKKDEKV